MEEYDFQKEFKETELKRITADILISYIDKHARVTKETSIDIDNICDHYKALYHIVLDPNTNLLQQKDND